MKRERQLNINGAGPSRDITDDQECYVLFIERIEHVIAEEKKFAGGFTNVSV